MKHLIFILTFIFFSPSIFGQSQKQLLRYKTSTGHVITVRGNAILYDNRRIFTIKYPDDIYFDSKSNRIIEDHGSVFLFLAVNGSPNLDRLNVFSITSSKAVLVTDAILSPIKDYDHDGFLEFGGSDLTEVYPNPDSMYYIPTAYYEIKNGKIHSDDSLTRIKDIEINGLYIPYKKQLDKNGSCCKVIPKPKAHRKRVIH
jgi:hypothetical protein